MSSIGQRAAIERLIRERDFLLGLLIDHRIQREINSRQGNYDYEQIAEWAAQSRDVLKAQARLADNAVVDGSGLGVVAGHYRKLARGEAP